MPVQGFGRSQVRNRRMISASGATVVMPGSVREAAHSEARDSIVAIMLLSARVLWYNPS